MKKEKKTAFLSAKQPDANPESTGSTPKVKKVFTFLSVMPLISGSIAIIGLVMFITYCLTGIMAIGAPSIFMIIGGGILFKYYWGKAGKAVVEHIGEIKKEQVNSMCLYPNKILFENTTGKEAGFPWQCLNDKKNYFVLMWDETINRLIPFILPDKQYYDRSVFAERVLELPAHQRIFTRKPKLLQRLKTALLVLAIGIVWLLILTTTNGG